MMKQNTISETVLSCKKQMERSVDELQSCNSFALQEDITTRQLIWSTRSPVDWEILVYKQGAGWEACFFRWPIHHEHAVGPSFESVWQRAEQRIRVLEARYKPLCGGNQSIDGGTPGIGKTKNLMPGTNGRPN